MTAEIAIQLTVNGENISASVEPRLSLVDFVREKLYLTGSHVGCEQGACGACTLTVDGEIVRGCLTLAVQADGCEVTTIEGASDKGEIADLQTAFHERNALQCGFCTPAMLLSADALLKQNPNPTRVDIRLWLSGNYCRCTGFHAIVDAIAAVVAKRQQNATARGI